MKIIVNGEEIARKEITADGNWSDIEFDVDIDRSSWVALRVYPSMHTNPIFVTVDDQPILSKRSAEWAQRSLDQAWKMKSPRFKASEVDDAKKAYAKARAVYVQKRIMPCMTR